MNRLVRTACAIVVSVAAISACSSDSDSSTSTSTTAAADQTTTAATDSTSAPASSESTAPAGGEVSVEASNGVVTLDAAATKIVSLSPTHTEMLFAIGAGDQVIAVDDQSNYPEAALAVSSDLSGYTPNVEAIAAFAPDLVVIGDDFNGLTDQLAAVDIPVWSGASAASLDDVYTQLEQLGVLTGHVGDAAELVGAMETDIAGIVAGIPDSSEPLTYYHELDPTYFSVTSDTFLGELYGLFGLQNIADQANADTNYPQLSSELIVSADPDLIFLADTKCCGQDAATVAARDGWADITAVVDGGVIEMDDDLASRWGPRVVDYLRAIAAAVSQASTVPAG